MNDFDWSTAAPAARAYRAALPPGELHVFPITALDVTGIPTGAARSGNCKIATAPKYRSSAMDSAGVRHSALRFPTMTRSS